MICFDDGDANLLKVTSLQIGFHGSSDLFPATQLEVLHTMVLLRFQSNFRLPKIQVIII